MNKASLQEKAITGSIVTSSGALGGVGGAAIANFVVPPIIEYVPGVQAEVSLSTRPGVEVDGIVTTVHAPHIPVHTHIPGLEGVKAQITEFNPAGGTGRFHDQYASLLTQFHERVVNPTSDILVTHLAKGAGIGAASAMGLSYLGLRHFRKQKALSEETRQQIQALRGVTTDTTSTRIAGEMESRLNSQSQYRRRFLAGAAAAVALMGATSLGGNQTDQLDPNSPQPQAVALNPLITKLEPELRGATITGLGGQLINTAALGATEYTASVNHFWQKAAKTFDKKFEHYASKSGRTVVNDPNLLPVLQISDLHCNYATMQYYLPEVIKQIKPAIILNTGDTYTNSNTMPYEKDCFTDFVRSVQRAAKVDQMAITVINIAGNHDPKKPINQNRGNVNVTTLTYSHPTATADGLTFVGLPDPLVSIWYPTLPADPAKQIEVIKQQGAALAKQACQVEQQTGVAPVVLSHVHQAGYETLLQGCASLALDGHTHHDSGVEKFAGINGHVALHHTAGTASGANVGITIYETPKLDTTVTAQYYDANSRTFVDFVTPTLHSDGTVQIKTERIPRKVQLAANIPDSPTYCGP